MLQTPFVTRQRTEILIIVIALAARVAVFLLEVDLRRDSYFEYGEIAKNLLAGKGYSLYHFDDGRLQYLFSPSAQPFPSAFMPPGYVMVLLPFIAVTDTALRNSLLFSFQTVLSLLTIILVLRYTGRHFGRTAAFLAAWCAALLPDFAYAPGSWTPTVLFQFLFMAFLELCDDPHAVRGWIAIPAIGLLSAAMVYLRSEWVLMVILLAVFGKVAGDGRRLVVAGAIALCLLVPWGIRNYAVFHQFVPLTTNGGLNLFRGENEETIGKWNDTSILEAIPSLPHDETFEPSFDRVYRVAAVRWMVEHPWAVFSMIPRKLLDLWLFNSVQERRFQAVVQICGTLLFLFFVIGAARTWSWSRHSALYLLLIHATLVGIIFFSLPRHQTMMRIGMLPFAGAGVKLTLDALRQWRLGKTL